MKERILSFFGTPIVSPTEAIVVRTGTGPSAGRYVYTANPGGETCYMHLDSIADIDRGDVLKPGDLVGTVDTGNAPDGVYHLHFEIRDDDNAHLIRMNESLIPFTLKEKASFLEDILKKWMRTKMITQFFVTTYGAETSDGEKG
ncbi:MAG: M23 family metallopeptidase [Candidatus Paceibacterota bacterium]